MTLGPIEIVTIGFDEGRFDGSILPELERLVSGGIISIVDGVFVHKAADDVGDPLELEEVTDDANVAALSALMREVDGLLNDEDVETLVASLPVGAAAAVLCFEHTWVVPLRDAIVAAGGEMLDSVRVPGSVVQEVLDAIGAEA